MLAADVSVLTMDRVSSKHALPSAVKTVVIGAVPDRGGVPEGYTLDVILLISKKCFEMYYS